MREAPVGLRTEHLDEALGLCTVSPRLSWKLPKYAVKQTGYRIRASNGWDSGRVERNQSILVPYSGPPLRSAQRVQWRVKVWTDLGESEWSAPSAFEMGLLQAEDWRAEWIEPGEIPAGEPGSRPAALLRCEFELDKPIRSARVYATSQGIYEGFLNGQPIGDAELTPGFTQYDARLQVQSYDVTAAVQPGHNALGVILADGWFRGLIGIRRLADQWGKGVALLLRLCVTYSDSTQAVWGTGPSWRSGLGHVVAADLVSGEQWDMRRVPRGWCQTGFDDTAWLPVSLTGQAVTGLVDSPAPPVRRVQELTPVSVRRLDEHRQVVDLGQNINGWMRLANLGPAGTTVRLVHGEWLDPSGDVTVENLSPAVPFLEGRLPAGQVDEVTSAGIPGAEFEPRRTTHGFQYVRIEGHPQDLTPEDLTGVVVHTDLRRTGWFFCSDERINRLHEAAVWSLRDNACDIPTDCPHRERAGWTGDWQLFVPTAAFLYDVAGFSIKWLRDVAADQSSDGKIAHISPAARDEGPDSELADIHGSAGWGDVAVLAPWHLYLAYGDTAVLAELWPTMTAWLSYMEHMARTGRHAVRVAVRPAPSPHEHFVWDSGFHWGEWLVPGEAPRPRHRAERRQR